MMRTAANLIITLPIAFLAAAASTAAATIDEQIAQIRSDYNVAIHYQLNTNLFFPAEWQNPSLDIEADPIGSTETGRLLPIIQTFLSDHPAAVIDAELEHIYLLQSLRFKGKSYGSTHHGRSLYIVSQGIEQGYDDTFLLCRLHSEFSSILLEHHAFPANRWVQFNPEGFRYAGTGFEMVDNPSCYDVSARACLDGFLVNYCRSSLENDVNMISSWLFVKRDQLNFLSQQYGRIREKQAIAEEFYRSLSGQYVFD